MKTYREVEELLSPAASHMVGDGFKVMNYYPNKEAIQHRMSPFFLMDYNAEVNFPPTEKPRGVGVHPHRGFETVTIAYKGAVAHHDSYGNSGVIKEGDVQWMTAGSGILHKEYHENEYSSKGGPFQMIQLWVNLPKKFKMTAPKYQAILHAQKGKVILENNGGTVHVIAGEYKGIRGPANTFSPVEMYDIRLNVGGEMEVELPANYNTGILILEGEVTINEGTKASKSSYLQFKNEAGIISIKASKDSLLLLLSGEPIHEPIANYGPFVMNTVQEIQVAVDDYNAGKFGQLS